MRIPILRLLRNVMLGAITLIVLTSYIVWRQWQIRDSVEDLTWPTATVAQEPGEAVTATWLGTTTLLFDDGETQVLIDGAFTRLNPLSIAFMRPVSSDIATINYALSAFRIDRLAAIIPVHSHFDHAIDVGYTANRTSAVVLGSESTANIARGADVPVDQYQILADGETRQFGDFTIKLIVSRHAPIRGGREEFFTGIIAEPLRQPAPVSAWKTGVAWSVVVSHPRGTTLVQGSGGYIEDKLNRESADVVMLGLGMVAGLGKDYLKALWSETVVATGARRVIAIHHDDYTQPFGTVRLLPNMIDSVVKSTAGIDEIIAASGNEITVELPPFGKPMVLY